MITNIAAYKFVDLNNLDSLREQFRETCSALELTGTVILSPEGINLMLSGDKDSIESFLDF